MKYSWATSKSRSFSSVNHPVDEIAKRLLGTLNKREYKYFKESRWGRNDASTQKEGHEKGDLTQICRMPKVELSHISEATNFTHPIHIFYMHCDYKILNFRNSRWRPWFSLTCFYVCCRSYLSSLPLPQDMVDWIEPILVAWLSTGAFQAMDHRNWSVMSYLQMFSEGFTFLLKSSCWFILQNLDTYIWNVCIAC